MRFIGPDTRGNRDICPSEARVNYHGFPRVEGPINPILPEFSPM